MRLSREETMRGPQAAALQSNLWVKTNRFGGDCAPPDPAPLGVAGGRGELWQGCPADSAGRAGMPRAGMVHSWAMDAKTRFEMALGLGGGWKVVKSEIDVESRELNICLDLPRACSMNLPKPYQSVNRTPASRHEVPANKAAKHITSRKPLTEWSGCPGCNSLCSGGIVFSGVGICRGLPLGFNPREVKEA